MGRSQTLRFERITSPFDAGTPKGTTPARPFCKAVGGKGKSIEFLLDHVPDKIATYREPMVGGGALFFALANRGRFQTAHINDMNEELMITYAAIREQVGVRDVAGLLSKMRYNKREFLRRRAEHPKNTYDRAARFIYLNKTCFNGLWRVNKAGQFNVPFGKYKNPTICDEENLRACHHALRDVQTTAWDFDSVCPERPKKRDFAYFDPPYCPVDETANFTSFTSAGFKLADHERLAKHFAALAKRGARLMLSNSDTPLARKLYRGFDVVRTKVARSISCDGDGRGKVGEILVLANL